MSTEKLDRLYAAMMAEAQAEEWHRAKSREHLVDADKCLERVTQLSAQIQAECAARGKVRAQNDFTDTVRDIVLGACLPGQL